MVKVAKRKRSNIWFYGIMVVFILGGYFAVQYALFFFSSCQGTAVWEWSKVPPGYVCSNRVNTVP